MVASWNPKEYRDDGRTVEWGKDLSPETMAALRNGEIFTLLDAGGKPLKRLVMDSYDQLRERAVGVTSGFDGFLGLPRDFHA